MITDTSPLPGFPPGQEEPLGYALPGVPELVLRRAIDGDLPFLRTLYAGLRADELRQTQWPEATQRLFLDSQFTLQHRHFVTHYAEADFWIVMHQGLPAGRFYLLRGQPSFLIVDIALLPALRGQGIGSGLINWAKSLAAQSGADGIDLHVDERNLAAQRLYRRLGFLPTAHEPPYFTMRWSRTAPAQSDTFS